MQHVTRAVDALTTAFAIVSGIAVTLLVLHVTLDVIFRSALGHTLPGTIPAVSNYYMVLIVCLPMAFVERKNSHISVDVLTNLFPQEVTYYLFGWTYLLSTTIFGLVSYGSWIEALGQYASAKFVIEQDIKISIWFGYFAVPLGYGLGATYALLKFIGFLLGSYHENIDDGLDSQVDRLSHD